MSDMTQQRYEGNLFYCTFCKKDIPREEVNKVPLPKHFHYESKKRRRYFYLCPWCGGTCTTAASSRKEYPEVRGTMKLRQSRRI
jgi:hypothetical protein